MSIQLSVAILDGNDPEFLDATTGTPQQLEEWEDEHGSINDRPGAHIASCYNCDAVTETNDEYGGLLIDLSKLPEGATHIVAYLS